MCDIFPYVFMSLCGGPSKRSSSSLLGGAGGACRAYSLMDSAYVASCRKFHTCCHPLKAQQPPFIDDSDSIPKAKASEAGKAIENVSRRTGQDILLRKCLTRDISRWKWPTSEFLNFITCCWYLIIGMCPLPFLFGHKRALLITKCKCTAYPVRDTNNPNSNNS